MAERLGRTVRELECGMDAYELAEWMAFDRFKRGGFEEEKPVITHPDQIDQEALAAQFRAVLGGKAKR